MKVFDYFLSLKKGTINFSLEGAKSFKEHITGNTKNIVSKDAELFRNRIDQTQMRLILDKEFNKMKSMRMQEETKETMMTRKTTSQPFERDGPSVIKDQTSKKVELRVGSRVRNTKEIRH